MTDARPAEFAAGSLDEALAEAAVTAATAIDQVQAAAQIQVERMLTEIGSAWRAQAGRVFEERLSALRSRIEEHYRSRLDAEANRLRESARGELAGRLNLAARRLRKFENEAQWSCAFVEVTAGLCDRAALWAVNRQTLELRAARNLPSAPIQVDLAAAPAFAGAIESRDTVIALRTRGELSETIAAVVGEAPAGRAYLFPLVARDRVRAVLYADSANGGVESSALELLTVLGAAVIDGLPPGRTAGSLQTVFGIEPASGASGSSSNPEQQRLHLRAQRSARVQVAGMRLYQSQAVKDGRTDGDLYAHLRAPIDAGRDAFRRDFLSISETMPDYFHLEVVRTLANDDEELLGQDYPGPQR